MPVEKLKAFLDKNKVNYTTVAHATAYTALEIAESAHIPGKKLAKVVIISLDGTDCMVVLPADEKVDLDLLAEETGASKVLLTNESHFRSEFPGCELGAMPPFGNLYGMDVYVSKRMADNDDILFNSGTHAELIQMPYREFETLVKPKKIA